ncbi:MAG: Gfo/Idh/MocA family oxidoreductase [Parvularculaceae bacterium]|nr:Gfo/Idh/MocA family oxidoreductase [Parvularculaceae bacterium]
MRFGLVGAGKIGALRATALKAQSNAELVAVFDVNKDAAARVAAGAPVFDNLEAFLAAPMDAVIISTPPHLHEEASVGAFERGLHVLCEKPMASTVEAGRRMVEAARKHDRVLAVGFNFRYYPFVKFVREAVDAGKIGRVDHVRLFGGHDGLHNFSADWQYKMPHSGGGAMMDIGIHLSDLARYFLGEITRVSGVMSENVYKLPGSEDNAMAIFVNPDGVAATYHATWTEWDGYGIAVEVYGERGMVRGSYAPMKNLLIEKDSPTGAARRTVKRYPEIMLREKLKSWTSTALITFEEEVRDFIAMVEGKAGVALADGRAGLRSLEVAAAVRESTASGRTIDLPPLR